MSYRIRQLADIIDKLFGANETDVDSPPRPNAMKHFVAKLVKSFGGFRRCNRKS